MNYGIRACELADGKAPFEEWLDGLRDPSAKARVLTAVSKMSVGNFGGVKSIKGVPELFEYRIDSGPGYRIVSAVEGSSCCGAAQSAPKREILTARGHSRDS